MRDQIAVKDALHTAVVAIADMANDSVTGFRLPAYAYEVFWIESTSDTGGQSVNETRYETSFHIFKMEFPELYQRIISEPGVSSFLKIASTFAEATSQKTTRFLSDGSHLAEQLLAVYFSEVGSFHLDEATLARVCQQFCYDVGQGSAKMITTYQVQQFEAQQEIRLDEFVRFRRLIDSDIDKFGRDSAGRSRQIPPEASKPWLNTRDWICQIETDVSKNSNRDWVQYAKIAEDVVSALGIVADGRSQFRLISSRFSSPFFQFGDLFGIAPFYSSSANGPVSLSAQDVEEFRRTYQILRGFSEMPSQKSLGLALRRFRLAASRTGREDQIVDSVIGLESLLTGDSENLEATFRFRLRGAALLPDSFGTPRQRIDLMNSIYRLRSQVVHGNAKPADLSSITPKAEAVFKEILRWYVGAGNGIRSPENVIRALDEALVEVGSRWAND